MDQNDLEKVIEIIRDFDNWEFFENKWSLNPETLNAKDSLENLIKEIREAFPIENEEVVI